MMHAIPPLKPSSRSVDGLSWKSYNWLVASVILVVLMVFMVAGRAGRDHFAAIAMKGDPAFYLDFSGRAVPEIQDQDLFYHNIGGSIDAARQADIVLLGPSFVSYAFEPSLLRQFEAQQGVRIYNMSFIGIRGGEFTRRIIARWQIRPRIWIINADDQFVHFFSRSLDLTLGPVTTQIPAASRLRMRGFASVAGRNLRWRLEGADGSAPGLYRDIGTGDVTVDSNPRYIADDNKQIRFDRGADCHVNPDTVAVAREYLKEIQGRVVLTLVPHSQYCPTQARELAQALGLEIIIPPDQGYTSIDGGGHLDRTSALKFTAFLLSELARSEAFAGLRNARNGS